MVSAILGTREGAARGRLPVGVDGSHLYRPHRGRRPARRAGRPQDRECDVGLGLLAAAALAQAVGNQTNYAQTALLYIEPDTATLAVVDSADGSIANVHREALPDDDDAAVAQLATMVSAAEALETRPDAVFVVGSGIDVPLIKPALEAATTLPLTAAEEPHTALARGAALASANAPLFVSSTAARAYAQDPGTGAIDPFAVAPGYFEFPAGARPARVPLPTALSATTRRHLHRSAHRRDHSRRRGDASGGRSVWWAAFWRRSSSSAWRRWSFRLRSLSGRRPACGPFQGTNVVAPARDRHRQLRARGSGGSGAGPHAAPAPVPAPHRLRPPCLLLPAAPAPVPAAPAPAPIPAAPAPAPPPVGTHSSADPAADTRHRWPGPRTWRRPGGGFPVVLAAVNTRWPRSSAWSGGSPAAVAEALTVASAVAAASAEVSAAAATAVGHR